MVAIRKRRFSPIHFRSLFTSIVSLSVLTLAGGCAKVCEDDGFAWQQDPSCLGGATQTESETNEEDSDSDSEPTETASEPTDSSGGNVFCTDGDGDGYGDKEMCTEIPPGEEPPPGTVDNNDDCADDDEFTFPGAAPLDDEDACMKDADGDDYGDMDPPGEGGPGEPVPGSDCDDGNLNTFPGSAPNDSLDACMQDNDGDDYGDDTPEAGPDGPDGPILPGTDCDDEDEGINTVCSACTDEDGDGWFGTCTDGMFPPDHPNPDCDDSDPNTFPGAAPNDDMDACMTDADDDDFGDDMPSNPDAVPGTDCDDSSDSTFPGSAPLDSDSACMKDADGDDHGEADPDNDNVTPGNDCIDGNPNVNPTDSKLVTAQISILDSGEILEIDVGSGMMTPVSSIETLGFTPWIPTSLAFKPSDGSVLASLAFKSRLVSMNYCGGGIPASLPAAHGRTGLCAIGYDRDDNLYGIDNVVDELIMFAADGSIASATKVTIDGNLLNVGDCGMSWDCHQSRMLLSDANSDAIYTIDVDTAVATRVADLPGETIGSGLAYEPVSKQALTCDNVAFYSVSIDGSDQFTKLADLMSDEPVDDLEFAPGCE